MSTPKASRRPTNFYIGFLLVALAIAGGLSYFASPDPDGLDTVALQGCEAVETPEGEELKGECLAQNATDHATAGSRWPTTASSAATERSAPPG